MAKIQKKKQLPVVHKPPPTTAAAEEAFGYIVPCPVCDKRSIDVSGLPERLIMLRYKCPHCNNLVTTPLVQEPNASSMQLHLLNNNN